MAEGQGSNPSAPASAFGGARPLGNLTREASPTGGPSIRGRGSFRGKPFANQSVRFGPVDSELTADGDYDSDDYAPETESKSVLGLDLSSSPWEVLESSKEMSHHHSKAAFQAHGSQSSSIQVGGSAFRPSSLSDDTAKPIPTPIALISDEDNRKKRFENLPKQNRFFEMKHQRDSARLEYIQQGILPDPDKAQDLSAAKNLLGTCMEMCPEFEREEREFQNEGDVLEMFPGSNRIDPTLAVKIYRRPAAGRELPLPEDVRPPDVLRQTLDYLFHQLLPADPSSDQFTAVQPFMWNRTRAIRQDFIVQGLRSALEIECHERIARYHILCLHWKGGIGAEGWSEQQELEQLRKTIRSLTEFYEDLRRSTNTNSPNEAEFRAYNLLLHMQDPETLREVELLPLAIFDSPDVQAALRLRGYAQRSNNVVRRGRPLNTESTMNLWTRFFGEIKRCDSVHYLLACLAENSFSQVRAGAIKAMSRTYLSQHAPLPLAYLCRSLGMDSEEEARAFTVALNCEEVHAGEGADPTVVAMRLAKANEDKPLPSAPFSSNIVEIKRGDCACQDIVDGKLSGAAPLLPIKSIVHLSQSTRATPLKTTTGMSDKISTPFSLPVPAALPHPPKVSTSQTSAGSLSASSNAATVSALSAAAPIFTPSKVFRPIPEASENASQALNPVLSPPRAFTAPKAGPFSQPAVSVPIIASASSSSGSILSSSNGTSFSLAKKADNDTADAARKRYQDTNRKQDMDPVNRSPSVQEAAYSLTQTHAIPQPSFIISKAKEEEHQPAKPKRTVASVASILARHMIEDFLIHKLENLGRQACLREIRVRRKDARRRNIDTTTSQLTKSLEELVVDELVASLASEAVADEFRSRCLEHLAVRRTTRAGQRAVELKKQRGRLEEVRMKLHGRSVLLSNGNGNIQQLVSGSRKSAISKVVGDGDLTTILLRAEENSRNLWTPGVFWQSIKRRLALAAPTSLSAWTVCYIACEGDMTTSQWLRRKLALDSYAIVEDTNRGGCKIRGVDASRLPIASLHSERDVGIVIFELSPSLMRQSSDAWVNERSRLSRLSSEIFISQSRLLPKLLLISWLGMGLRNEEEGRKFVTKQLHLGATGPLRFVWSQIEVCQLGDLTTPVQVRFDKSLKNILGGIEFNDRRSVLTLEATSALCQASWKKLLQQTQIAFSRVAQAKMDSKEMKTFTIQVFTILTALANRALDDLVRISDTLLDTQEDKMYPSVPVVPKEEVTRAEILENDPTVEDLLQALALLQLTNCLRETKEDRFAMLQSWLLQHYQNSHDVSFPWTSYFEQVYQYYVARLEGVWLECDLSRGAELDAQLLPTQKLCNDAWTEIEWKLQDIASRCRDKSWQDSDRKKRTFPEDDEDGNVKLRRLESTSMPLAKSKIPAINSADPIRSKPVSAGVSSLKSLMLSATQLLPEN